MVGVSSDNSDNIQFIDIDKTEVYNEIQITGSEAGAMAVSNTNLVVGCKGSVHVLDHQGNPVYIVTIIRRHHNHISTRYCSYITWFILGLDLVLVLVLVVFIINQ
jgi:hypothetical protein